MSQHQQSTSTMAEAFLAAGYKAPFDELIGIGVEAWLKWSTGDGAGARRDYVVSRLEGELTWALIRQWQPTMLTQAVGWLLNRAKDAIEDQKPERKDAGHARSAGGRGHNNADTQKTAAPAASPQDDAKPQAERLSEPARYAARPIPGAPAAPSLTTMADRQSAAMASKRNTIVRLSRLDTVVIDGTPIGDCTVSQVKAWATQRKRDAQAAGRDERFAMALVANLSSDAVIREWWKDTSEVDAIYAKAEAEYVG